MTNPWLIALIVSLLVQAAGGALGMVMGRRRRGPMGRRRRGPTGPDRAAARMAFMAITTRTWPADPCPVCVPPPADALAAQWPPVYPCKALCMLHKCDACRSLAATGGGAGPRPRGMPS